MSKTTTRFTPGPWAVNPSNPREIRAHGHIIAKTGGDYYDDGYQDIKGAGAPYRLDTRANAQLIAIAPQLHEVLAELVRLLDAGLLVNPDTLCAERRLHNEEVIERAIYLVERSEVAA